jgi:phosphate-selective porin OprO/OprP
MLTLLVVTSLVRFPTGVPATYPNASRTDTPPAILAADDTAPVVPPVENELQWMWKDGLRLESADGAYKFKVGGRIFWDNTWISADEDFQASGLGTEDGSEFRAARLFMEGTVEEYFFKAEYDFSGDPDFKDVFMGKTDVLGEADVRAGHYKEPFSIEQLTSSRYLTFMERALPDAFTPQRNAGISIYDSFANDHLTWAAGVFRTVDDLGAGQEDGGYSLTGRLAGGVIQNEAGEPLLHAGVSVSAREGDNFAFSQRPEAHLTDVWVDTGTLDTEDALVVGVELATVLGPVHAAAEYIQSDVSLDSGAGSDPTFDGYYVQVGWFLTGEHRAYNKSQAAFDRTRPKKSWSDKEGGIGAWEAAVRYSNIDLTDEAISGGELDDVTLGVNWYMNPNMRLMFNYVMSNLENGSFDESADIFMVRFQVDW